METAANGTCTVVPDTGRQSLSVVRYNWHSLSLTMSIESWHAKQADAGRLSSQLVEPETLASIKQLSDLTLEKIPNKTFGGGQLLSICCE